MSSPSKIRVIIAHEYKTRVKSKWFVLFTLLGPVVMALLIAIPVVAAMMAGDGAEGKVAVVDRSGQIGAQVIASDTSQFTSAGSMTDADLKQAVLEERLQAYVVIPPDVLDSGTVTLYSRGGSGIAFESSVQDAIEPLVVNGRLRRVGTDTSVIRLVEEGIAMQSLKISEQGVEEDASKASAMVGYFAGFMIYMLIFLYGSMVMRGVVDEKANRIIEVLASSARPFHIMMGKVIGIGLVGLTQLAAWGVLGLGVVLALGAVLGSQMQPDQAMDMVKSMPQAQAQMQMSGGAASALPFALPSISLGTILLFIFFFLAGYFIYATLYAAVGSAVDQEADANQLTLPITLPVVLTIMFIGNVIAAPNGTLAVVLSLIPLFAPILMTVRLAATDVPWWQVVTSMSLCIAFFFGAVWLASRIYRIGILSYGRKPSFKDIAKWITMKV
jgi:ABC-2 type transport system permease protein